MRIYYPRVQLISQDVLCHVGFAQKILSKVVHFVVSIIINNSESDHWIGPLGGDLKD